MPELESLKRQIDAIKREIANRESVRDSIEHFCPPDYKSKLQELMDENQPSIEDLYEVLATLERLTPPF